MKRLCTYIVTEDTGFAPNPFWEWCTLAACTPNHRKNDFAEGDWIAGFLSKQRDHRLLYAMELSAVLSMACYFNDRRFQKKKPCAGNAWQSLCGDNVYEFKNDVWVPHTILFHNTLKHHDQDTKFHKVFIASRYWYFGQNHKAVPSQFKPLIVRYRHLNHPDLAQQFAQWIELSFEPGIHGEPNDIRAYTAQLTRNG
jgi:hypothetical protein